MSLSIEVFIHECAHRVGWTCATSGTCANLAPIRPRDALDALAEIDQLRARLAAAEAVIAALPRCERFINNDVGYCPRVATREDSVGGSGEYFTRYWCDEHQPYGADDDTLAADEIRAYLALVEADR